MYFKVLEQLCKTELTIMQFQGAAPEICSECFKQNPSKIPVSELIFCKVLACKFTKTAVFNKSFQGSSLDYQKTLFPEQLFMTRSQQRVPNTSYVMKTPYISYTNFLKFCPTPLACRHHPSPPLLFWMSCFFGCILCVILLNDIMNLYMSSLGTLVSVFYAKWSYVY